jgi:ubiquitin C-terminal hydrolase
MRIPAFHADWHRAITPCRIGDDLSQETDRPSHMFDWLRSLSSRFTATVKKLKTKTHGFQYEMRISVLCSAPCMRAQEYIHVFSLLFQEDLMKHELRMHDTGLLPYVADNDVCLQQDPCERDLAYPYVLFFLPTDAWANKRLTHHPFNVLRTLAGGPLFTKLDKDIKNQICPDLVKGLSDLAMDKAARENLGKTLADLTGGAVKVTYTMETGSNLTPCGANGFLFRLTCVFPWAIDILLRRPNCLMTDSTFKVLAPYTLPILHAIFANESIPIAFGISPTETAACYEDMYACIEKAFDSLRNAPPSRSSSQSVPRTPGDGEWAEDHQSDREERFTGEFIPPAWTGEVQTIVNAITVLPPPDQCGRDFLKTFPIVTDQGTALEKFVKDRQLDWKLCHRHIIEAVGAGGLLGQWATRLLGCYSEAEWDRTRAVIMDEMVRQKGEYSQSVPGYTALLKLLGFVAEKDTHVLASKARWALWERKGCPRTTNSAESVNGHLNHGITLTAALTERIKQVARHFMNRYASRNTWCDRALRRNAHNCFPSEEMQRRAWFSRERVEFHQMLHNATDLDHPVKRQFAPENHRYFFRLTPENCCVEKSGLPPKWWSKKSQPHLPGREAAQLPLHHDACQTRKAHLAWQIAYSLRRRLGQRIWTKCSTQVFTAIVEIGTSLGVPDNDEPPTAQEATWRADCWAKCHEWCNLMAKQEEINEFSPEDIQADIDLCEELHRFGDAAAGHVPRSQQRSSKPAKSRAKRQKARKSTGPAPRGLVNERLTCYMNAVLQSLLHLRLFHAYFSDERTRIALDNRPELKVAAAYCKLQTSLALASRASLSPLALRTAMVTREVNRMESVPARPTMPNQPDPPFVPPWSASQSHDAEEFLNLLLQILDAELNALPPEHLGDDSAHHTIVSHLFTGDISSEGTYNDCHHEKRTTEQFWVLTLPLQEPGVPAGHETESPPESIPLETCFKWFSIPALQNDAECSQCGCRQKISVAATLTALPPVLVLHLGRFPQWAAKPLPKIETNVTFPLVLDMKPYLKDGDVSHTCTYNLASVIYHSGRTLEGGHFVAYVKKDTVWYKCNDRVVTTATADEVTKTEAYLLFYELVSLA